MGGKIGGGAEPHAENPIPPSTNCWEVVVPSAPFARTTTATMGPMSGRRDGCHSGNLQRLRELLEVFRSTERASNLDSQVGITFRYVGHCPFQSKRSEEGCRPISSTTSRRNGRECATTGSCRDGRWFPTGPRRVPVSRSAVEVLNGRVAGGGRPSSASSAPCPCWPADVTRGAATAGGGGDGGGGEKAGLRGGVATAGGTTSLQQPPPPAALTAPDLRSRRATSSRSLRSPAGLPRRFAGSHSPRGAQGAVSDARVTAAVWPDSPAARGGRLGATSQRQYPAGRRARSWRAGWTRRSRGGARRHAVGPSFPDVPSPQASRGRRRG